MGSSVVDFYGISFEVDYNLFGNEFEEVPGVYVVYNTTGCLDIGATDHLKTALETHQNTRQWLKKSEGDEIYIAFHYEDDPESREDKEFYLRAKMRPACQAFV